VGRIETCHGLRDPSCIGYTAGLVTAVIQTLLTFEACRRTTYIHRFRTGSRDNKMLGFLSLAEFQLLDYPCNVEVEKFANRPRPRLESGIKHVRVNFLPYSRTKSLLSFASPLTQDNAPSPNAALIRTPVMTLARVAGPSCKSALHATWIVAIRATLCGRVRSKIDPSELC
jgi:hypothetical protein